MRHESKTDPEAQRARKSEGKESKLSVTAEVFVANGTVERDAALVMLEKLPDPQPVNALFYGQKRAG
jgi:hypothetical protein